MNNETVRVHIKYRDIEQTFTGDAEQVWANINRFFSEIFPATQTIKKALLTVDLQKLIEDCEGIIAIATEGPVVLAPKQKLTDSEALTLNLLAAYIGSKLGYSKDYLSKEELQAALGKTAKITSTRLGELIREGLAAKTEEGNYRITTLGIKRFQNEDLPEIKEKLQS